MSTNVSPLTKSPTNQLNADVAVSNPTIGLNVFDLRKAFTTPRGDRLEVLSGVSFDLKSGEVAAVTGVSGSGKSTLLHLLGGLDSPDHGVISLEGIDIARLPTNKLPVFRQGHIGFVFQAHHLLLDLSALENVALPLYIARQNKAAALSAAKDLLQEVGLGGRLDYPISHLSGGEQQRVAISRALIGNPGLLLADEPTGNLDAAMSEEITQLLIDQTHIRGTMTIIATHSDRLASACNREFRLENGRI
jgi:lipoprotein-releasing system ATP-binding protein